ncbi:MAG TPA: MFS transporter [Stellaceae bacterium]|nr:MFS transporter [Stellaceae bacterium]
MPDHAPLRRDDVVIETRTSWRIAVVSMLIIAIGWGAPYLISVALKAMAADLGAARSVPSLASSLCYIGIGVGGIFMGWWADRVGAMWTALLGSIMVGAGAMVASGGAEWQLYLGFGAMIGLLGGAGLFAPLMSNTSRWFDARRGTALAIVASGQQLAGLFWPQVFRYALEATTWRTTLFWYGAFVLAVVPALCVMLRHKPPVPAPSASHASTTGGGPTAASNLIQAALCIAIVFCCVPMALPLQHLVAFCSDLGYAQARGTEMLTLLLIAAFLSRWIWGRMSDRIGGLRTILVGSLAQAAFLACYLFVDHLYALYAVSAAFGIGFGGIIPSYVLTVRDLFPAREAGWRIGTVLFFGLVGMALGAWLGGALYDWFAYYKPAFALGVVFNILNLVVIGGLLARGPSRPILPMPRTA